jgi:AhpC/TSA antioxidant enzyme
LCREEGLDLANMQKDGLLGNARVIGLVKEIAPCATAKDDAELGVEEFQTKYFNGLPLYLDAEKAVYSALGDRKITELKGTWNPFELWKGLKGIGERIKEKNLEGNFRGEGLVLGGIIVIKKGETRFTYYEESGKEIPRESIIAAVKGK